MNDKVMCLIKELSEVNYDRMISSLSEMELQHPIDVLLVKKTINTIEWVRDLTKQLKICSDEADPQLSDEELELIKNKKVY